MQCNPRFYYYYYKDYDLLPLLLFPFYSNKTHFKENRLKIIIRQIPPLLDLIKQLIRQTTIITDQYKHYAYKKRYNNLLELNIITIIISTMYKNHSSI